MQRSESRNLKGKARKERAPRNVAQVRTIKAKMKKDSKVEDPEAMLMYHSVLHPKYLPVYARIASKLYVVARMPEMDDHLKEVLKHCKSVACHYDTTFDCGNEKCGRYYVSILFFRHPYLRGRNIIPLRILYHEDKESFGHEMMFRNLVENIPMLNSRHVTLVTDREAAIRKNACKYLPDVNHIFCYMHMAKVLYFVLHCLMLI